MTRRLLAVAVTTVRAVAGCAKSTGSSSSPTVTSPQVAAGPTIPPPPAATFAPATSPSAGTAPRITAPPIAAAPVTKNLCGAPANPLGYNLCGGTMITSPDQSTCRYFNCISNFSIGTGYMEEFADATYTMSGGHQGVCSTHGGPKQPVYR
ncbi:MAG: hypothetical protein M3R71_01050 [Actinomycetota bacterium]|nr:hypothetical protein [Actinomycetota bacterium]